MLRLLSLLQEHSQAAVNMTSLARALVLCSIIMFPFMLPHIYSHFAIPKGYEGVANEDLSEEERENFYLEAHCLKQRLAGKCVD